MRAIVEIGGGDVSAAATVPDMCRARSADVPKRATGDLLRDAAAPDPVDALVVDERNVRELLDESSRASGLGPESFARLQSPGAT